MQPDRRIFQNKKVIRLPLGDTPITLNDIVKNAFSILLVVVGFLLSYTFYDFSNNLKEVKADVSVLKVSFSALAQHVQDEDNQRAAK